MFLFFLSSETQQMIAIWNKLVETKMYNACFENDLVSKYFMNGKNM